MSYHSQVQLCSVVSQIQFRWLVLKGLTSSTLLKQDQCRWQSTLSADRILPNAASLCSASLLVLRSGHSQPRTFGSIFGQVHPALWSCSSLCRFQGPAQMQCWYVCQHKYHFTHSLTQYTYGPACRIDPKSHVASTICLREMVLLIFHLS